MRPFRVVLEGSWTPEKWNDIAGFYATRIVLAEGPDEAAEAAKERLLHDLPDEMPGCPTPALVIDSIYEADAEQLLGTTRGFTFYADPD